MWGERSSADARFSIRTLARLRTCIWLVMAILAGCRVGPEYESPQLPMPDQWQDQHQLATLRGEPLDADAWWQAFDDPALQVLICEVRESNLSLCETGTRILEAQAVAEGARGILAPQTQAAYGGLQHVRISENSAEQVLAGALGRNHLDVWNVGLSAAWELDFWGRYQRQIAAADAELEASIENYHDSLVLHLAETAHTYVQLRTLEQRLLLLEQNVALQEQTLALTTRKARAGVRPQLDVLQASANLEETKAQVPDLEALHRLANNRLCVLLGRPPVDLEPDVGRTAIIPAASPSVACGVPADLLRRRPDVRRAERELAAQSQRIGIAMAEFYPHLSLTGDIGLDALSFGNLFEAGSLAMSVGPTFRWNLLNYGRIQASVEREQARYQRLLWAYQQAVLRADEEAENAIVRYLKGQERVARLEQSVRFARQSVDEAVVAYEKGVLDFQRLSDLELQLLAKQDSLATAQGQSSQNLVAVYRALGGGWQTPTHEPAIQPSVFAEPLLSVK